ncbi:phage tail protein [Deinococcus aquaticus]|uniref:Phage tail protein n=1 Tax=Deinococcus aquaticus TaxID=328692 RepID=A0ABY7V883_9DEIO|nr:phage tail protein [Deinococcus aquaticus]WDA60461.1 phage tail protein [Deinococcus aquaticus]
MTFRSNASFNGGRPRVSASLSVGPLGQINFSAGADLRHPAGQTFQPRPVAPSERTMTHASQFRNVTPQQTSVHVLSNHRYQVSIDGLEHAAFSEVSGLQVETETMDFIEGGVNDRVLRLPVRSRVGNLILKRGMVAGNELLEWHLNVVQGYLDVRNITITVYDHPTSVRDSSNHYLRTADPQVRMRFELLQAYPVKWSGPTFNGNGDAVAVESLELAHSGFLQLSR